MTRTVKVKEKPVRKPLDTSLLPVKEINLYPEGTTTEDGELKDDFVEIGTEETLRLERIPEKVYIVKTIRHKVIRNRKRGISLSVRFLWHLWANVWQEHPY